MDNSKTLNILYQEKQRAIELGDFEQAKAIDSYMNDLKGNTLDQKTTIGQRSNQRIFDIEKENIRSDASNCTYQASKDIYLIKINAQKSIAQRQKVHAEEMANLAESHAKALENSQVRPVPDAVQLRKSAKNVAMNSEYDQSNKLFRQADHVEEEEISARLKEIEFSFQKQERALIAKHQAENDNIISKTNELIKQKETEFEIKITNLKRRLRTQMLKYQTPMSNDEIDSFFNEFKIKDESPDLYRPIRSFQDTPNSKKRKSPPKKPSPKSPRITESSPLPHYMSPRLR